MKTFIFILIGLSFLGVAHARIGEDQTQMSTRYGMPREDRGNTNLNATLEMNCTKTYFHQGWELKTEFVNNQAQMIVYMRPGVVTLQANEIQSILAAESNGGKWTKIHEGLWSNSNGTSADVTLSTMTVKSAAKLRREDADRNKKTVRQAPSF